MPENVLVALNWENVLGAAGSMDIRRSVLDSPDLPVRFADALLARYGTGAESFKRLRVWRGTPWLGAQRGVRPRQIEPGDEAALVAEGGAIDAWRSGVNTAWAGAQGVKRPSAVVSLRQADNNGEYKGLVSDLALEVTLWVRGLTHRDGQALKLGTRMNQQRSAIVFVSDFHFACVPSLLNELGLTSRLTIVSVRHAQMKDRFPVELSRGVVCDQLSAADFKAMLGG